MRAKIVYSKDESRESTTSGSTGIRTQIYGSLPVHSSSHSSFIR